VTGWRRIANAMWSAPEDPQIFGELDIEAAAVMAVIERARAAGHRLTPTHLVGRAVAHALEVVPDLNVRIRGGRAYPRPSIDILFLVAEDLAGCRALERTRTRALAPRAWVRRSSVDHRIEQGWRRHLHDRPAIHHPAVQSILRRDPAHGAALRVGAGMGKEMAVSARARSAPGASAEQPVRSTATRR
jgi:hypothetical protein